MNYLTNNNWVYKAGCASMITALALGARYGRVGAIPDAKVIVFNRALTYHIITCNNHHLFSHRPLRSLHDQTPQTQPSHWHRHWNLPPRNRLLHRSSLLCRNTRNRLKSDQNHAHWRTVNDRRLDQSVTRVILYKYKFLTLDRLYISQILYYS